MGFRWLVQKAKAAKKTVWRGGTAVSLEAQAVPVSLTCAGPWKLAGTAMPLLGTTMLDKIVHNLHIFGTNQLQITFLFLQDAIFEIFVPEIKYLAIEVK